MPNSRNRPAAPVMPRPAGAARTATTRSRFVRRILVAAAAGLAMLVLARTGVLDQALQGVGAGRQDWRNDYQLVEHLRDLVIRRGLTTDKRDCLLFIINGNDPPTAVRMQVMEKHSGSCPGPRGTLPLLFTLRVDRLAHDVQTDAGSPGRFHPLS